MDKREMKASMSTCHIYAHTYIYYIYNESQRLYITFYITVITHVHTTFNL